MSKRVLKISLGNDRYVEHFEDVFILTDSSDSGYVISIQGCERIYEAVEAARKFVSTMEGIERLHDAIMNLPPEDVDCG